ncbi:unnamed protein product, partial [Tetraodon nigroviridis]
CGTRQAGLLLPRLPALLLQRGHGQEDPLQQPGALPEATGEAAVAPPTATPAHKPHPHFVSSPFRNTWRRKRVNQRRM